MLSEEKLSQIKRLYNDESIIVFIMPPPKYLLPFIENSNIIFVYKRKEEVSNSYVAHRIRGKSNSDSDDDVELTGQPLECPFSSDDESDVVNLTIKSKEEDNHIPLELNEARKVMSSVNLEINPTVPLFTLTDGSDKYRTIILGTAKTSDGWCTRHWINVQDFAVQGAKVCNVDDMINKHNQLSQIHPKDIVSEVSCQYFMEAVGDAHTTFHPESGGWVEFNLTWKTPSFTVPLDKIRAQIIIKSCIGHENSEISALWHHLTLLYDYLEIIKKWKCDKNTQSLYSRHYIDFPNIIKLTCDDPNPKPLQDRLSQLLQEPNESNGIALTGRMTENEKKTFEETIRKIKSEKREVEFTDRLWTLLIECSSYEEMCTCFDKVFQAVKNGICKPYIKSTNISRLAHALRCCRSDPNRFSSTIEPMELLIEIGIEKLKKDLVGIFLLAKAVTAEQLHIPMLPKYPDIPLIDWLDNCSQWIIWLSRIHISLQLMLSTENTIKFKGCIIPLTSSTLKHYLGLQSPVNELADPRSITTQSFTTDVDSTDIQDLFNRKTPFNSWKLKLHSETGSRRVSSIFYRDMSDAFPSSVSTSDNMEGSANNTYTMSAFPYHCYNFHSVSDRFTY